ncbi:MAG: hypothetical protein IT480_02405 [Gammaproteobacteria bacterium]|nr:hypothetical protein [Gammaproteobacteria bacterium]
MSVQDEIAKWPAKTTCSLEHTEPHRANRVLHAAIDEVRALEARLRTADEALRLYVAWCEAETTYVPTFYERMAMCAEAEHAARAYLAAREKER